MITRILQNQADGSPGNGAPVTPPAAVETPAQPAAQTPAAPAAPAPADADAIAAKVRDSLFAELRKAGLFEKNKPAPASGAKPNGEAQAPQADPIKLRALDRALSRTGLADKLTDAQYRRAERDFVVEDPSDADSWAKDYFTGFVGSHAPAPVQNAATVAAQPAAPAQPSNAIPASSRGAPPAPQVPLEEMNPWTMSETDRDAFIKQKGIKVYLEKARQFGKGIVIDPRK